MEHGKTGVGKEKFGDDWGRKRKGDIFVASPRHRATGMSPFRFRKRVIELSSLCPATAHFSWGIRFLGVDAAAGFCE